MKTRRLGYHHLVLPDGRCQDMVVVEVDDKGNYVRHHALRRDVSLASYTEEPFVEWVGGTLKVAKVGS